MKESTEQKNHLLEDLGDIQLTPEQEEQLKKAAADIDQNMLFTTYINKDYNKKP